MFTADSLSHCNLEEIADILNSCYYIIIAQEVQYQDFRAKVAHHFLHIPLPRKLL